LRRKTILRCKIFAAGLRVNASLAEVMAARVAMVSAGYYIDRIYNQPETA
jgi:hypothetical protein